jgi:hypothetical protein
MQMVAGGGLGWPWVALKILTEFSESPTEVFENPILTPPHPHPKEHVHFLF